MTEWLTSLSPRLQGVATVLIGTGVVGVGFLVQRMLEDQFYPIVFVAAGFILPLGLSQAIAAPTWPTGGPPERPWWPYCWRRLAACW